MFGSRTLISIGAITCISGPAFADAASGQGSNGQASGGHLIADARLRMESVDQDGFSKDATALTARLRFGYETAEWRKLKGLVEFEHVEALIEDYNSTTNGETTRPTVLDPEATEINRFQVTWAPKAGVTATLGRQRLAFDDARFVGDSAFRQNQQTFDAVRGQWRASANLSFDYAYIGRVLRVVGPDSSTGSISLDGHAVNVTYKPNSEIELVGYGYLFDFERALPSSDTWGARVTFSHPLSDDWRLDARLEAAQQTEHDGPSFDLTYWRANIGVKHGGASAMIGRETLEGDGVRGFSTPLASLHPYQGWADVFTTTPADGVVDSYGDFGYTWTREGFFSRPGVRAVYHDFESDRNSRDFGSEVDVLASAALPHNTSLEVKASLFDGDNGFADRDKFWITIGWKL